MFSVYVEQKDLGKPLVSGRWYKTVEGTSGTEYVGVCGKCGSVKAAIEIAPRQLPFGRGFVWACKQGCC